MQPGPVDIVIKYLDDADPAWRACLEAHLPKGIDGREGALCKRFTNWGQMKYALRSICQYANFFRRLHLVTFGHVPDWLNADHPKVNVVTHKEIFADPAGLPTFNSNAIDMNLHNIPDLADRFVFFEDDMFINRRCRYDTFFSRSGKPKFIPMPFLTINYGQDLWKLIVRNNYRLIRSRFPKSWAYKHCHFAMPLTRQVLLDVTSSFPREVAATSGHKYRCDQDLDCYLYQHYLMAQRKFARTFYLGYFFNLTGDPDHVRRSLRSIRWFHRFVCVNDEFEGTDQHQTEIGNILRDYLERRFPETCELENLPQQQGTGAAPYADNDLSSVPVAPVRRDIEIELSSKSTADAGGAGSP